MIDDMGNQIYPGSIDNGAIDVEYSPTIERKICAQDERFASVNEAIGTLQYNLEQHIEKCADGLAPLADFITSSWAVIDELEARIAKLEAAQRPHWLTPPNVNEWIAQNNPPFAAAAHPPEGDWAHIPSAEWEAICEELEALRAKDADVEMLQRMVAGLQRTDSVSVEIIRRLSSELRDLRAFKAGVWDMANAVTCPVCDSKGGRMAKYIDHLEVWTECRWCNGHGVLYARPKEAGE